MSDVDVTIEWLDPTIITLDLEDPPAITFEFVDSGTGGSGAAATHNQGVAASTWTFVHNLGYHPAVTTFMNDGTQFMATVTHPDLNTSVITLAAAISGYAYAS